MSRCIGKNNSYGFLVISTALSLNTSHFFISVFNQLDSQNLFHNKIYFMPLHVLSTCAHHQRSKLHYTASGIITPIGGRLVHETTTYRRDDTGGCVMQF